MALVFLLYALFASVFVVTKGALYYASPFFLVGSRMALAGLLMLFFVALRNPSSLRLSSSSLTKVLLLAFFNIYLTNILELWGLQHLTSFKTCFIYSLSPFLTALFSYFFLHEIMTKRKWLGLFIGFMGFIPILLAQNPDELLSGHFWLFSSAELAVMGAVISSVLGWILLKQLVHGEGSSPLVANGYSMLIGGLFALLHSFLQEKWDPFPVQDAKVWLYTTLFLIIVSNMICYNLYGYLLKRFSTTFLSFAGLSTPIFTAILGWIIFQEAVGISFFISLVVVFIGLFIFYLEEIPSLVKKGKDSLKKEDKGGEVLIPYSEEPPDSSHS